MTCDHDTGFYVVGERGGSYFMQCVNCGASRWVDPEDIRLVPESLANSTIEMGTLDDD